MTNDEIKQAYRGVQRRGRVLVWGGLLVAVALPFTARFVTASVGVALPGAVGFGLFLGTLVVMAIAGFRIARCPACHAYIGSEPIHKWGKPRVCRGCGVALS